ncbi:hypothetical protein ACFOLF_01820 [Paenibacillus sepulcri]
MGGRVWYWGGGGAVWSMPQAWSDGIPLAGDAVIVCGESALPADWRREGEPLILNGGAAAFALRDAEETQRRLEQAGVATAPLEKEDQTRRSDGQYLRLFTVALFNLQPISVSRHLYDSGLKGWRGEQASRLLEPSSSLYRPLTRIAVKALYALGLDMGLITLQANEQGRYAVVEARLPSAEDMEQTVWKTAAADFAADIAGDAAAGSEAQGAGIMLGADPEFLLLGSGGKVISAARYLEGGQGAGCDAVLIGGRVRYPVAELRPEPASTVMGLAGNIRRLLGQAAVRITDPTLRWSAGGMPVRGFALGGHIHLSGVRMTGRLLRQLDSYVALPLAMVESPAEHARRPRYGFLGDFRMQPHGGFEYRTLPSWLHSPAAAKAVFALSLLCARESARLSYRPSEEAEIAAAYYKGDRELLRTRCLEPLAKAMAGTPAYRELKVYIEPLLEAARRGSIWDVSTDIRQKWRIAPFQ